MQADKTLKELAEYLGGVVRGDENCRINGLAPLDSASSDKITFLANPKYAAKVAETGAGAVLMAPGGESYGRNVIEVSNPIPWLRQTADTLLCSATSGDRTDARGHCLAAT